HVSALFCAVAGPPNGCRIFVPQTSYPHTGIQSMAMLLNFFFGKPEDWKQWFAAEIPELDVRFWPETGNRDDIDVIACGWLPEGEFKTFPNLKLIVSLLAGPD